MVNKLVGWVVWLCGSCDVCGDQSCDYINEFVVIWDVLCSVLYSFGVPSNIFAHNIFFLDSLLCCFIWSCIFRSTSWYYWSAFNCAVSWTTLYLWLQGHLVLATHILSWVTLICCHCFFSIIGVFLHVFCLVLYVKSRC
jgi:hypothetical protein